MDPHQLLGFAAVSVTLAMTPGADWAYSIAAGLGARRIAPAVAGLCAGYLLHTALIVAGLAALIAARPELLSLLTLLGAAYLLWLGASTVRSWRSAGFAAGGGPVPAAAPVPPPADAAAAARGRVGAAAGAAVATAAPAGPAPARQASRRAFLRGLGTSGTNPKALLLYLALIPQFVDAGAALPVPAQSLALGLLHFAVSVGVYSGVALGARLLLRSRPGAARAVTLASGVTMVGLGLALVAEQAAALLA